MKAQEYLKTIYRWLFRTHKSYSQAGEDLLANLFLGAKKSGFYVDVGANDPIHLSNSYFFYKKGWKGLCIEPNVARCQIYTKVRRRDKVLNMGVAEQAGFLDYYEFSPDSVSTFSAEEAEGIKKLGHPLIGKRKIKTLPLKEILQKYCNNTQIDLLSVDTEGLDLEVLKSNDWEKFRPKLIIVEIAEYKKDHATRMHKVYDDYLFDRGYIKVADTYINGIYMEKSFAAEKKFESII